ncbi:hypothetical protein LP52_07455 [Streptomonospora alba]|uniref:DUF3592 domain-containing protein n=1 Tax=Streptomonospora alba TaxID=183763 RepID=A0A0C2JKI6_9ACTN|nr:DUF3592 domain-containing protein [Streptomonospora alba]KIH99460.1 hypothetical protein LP52_07455 [Streptomonospora alba]
MDTPGTDRPPPSRRRRVVSAVFAVLCGILALVMLFIGGVLLLFGHEDYADYTGRAEAVVNAVESEEGSGITTAYVDFRADGREYTRVALYGMNVPELSGGDRLTVAYDPADPGGEVTTVESTDGKVHDTLFWPGVAAVFAAGIAGTGMLVLFGKAIGLRLKRPAPAG